MGDNRATPTWISSTTSHYLPTYLHWTEAHQFNYSPFCTCVRFHRSPPKAFAPVHSFCKWTTIVWDGMGGKKKLLNCIGQICRSSSSPRKGSLTRQRRWINKLVKIYLLRLFIIDNSVQQDQLNNGRRRGAAAQQRVAIIKIFHEIHRPLFLLLECTFVL